MKAMVAAIYGGIVGILLTLGLTAPPAAARPLFEVWSRSNLSSTAVTRYTMPTGYGSLLTLMTTADNQPVAVATWDGEGALIEGWSLQRVERFRTETQLEKFLEKFPPYDDRYPG